MAQTQAKAVVRLNRDTKRRITLPKHVHKELGLEAGDYVKITVEKLDLDNEEQDPESEPERMTPA